VNGVAAVVQQGRDASAPARRGVCASMLDAMPHRGATSWNHAANGVALAVRAHHPGCFASLDGVHVGVDGDIHNRAELGFAEDDDVARVVLGAYQRWGVDAVGRFVGDFAFVLHDERQRTLLAARDAIGMCPLYVHRGEDGLRIASEAQALVASGVDAAPNELAVALFVAMAYSEDGYTLRKHVEALPPGHMLIATPERVTMRRHWQPDPWRTLDVDIEEAAEMFAETFREAVRCRLPRSGKLGVTVSGGLDSSSIACQAAAMNNIPTALHCSLAGWDADETPISRTVAAKWNMPTIEVAGGGADMREASRPKMRHPDLLFNVWSSSMEALIGRAAGAGLDTMMTGLGADQMMDESGGECVDALRGGALRDVAAITGLDRDPTSINGYRRLWRWGIKPLVPARLRFATRHWRPQTPPAMLSKTWAKRVIEHGYDLRIAALDERWPNAASQARCALLAEYGIRVGAPQSTLRGALEGIVVAHPFLDRRVFELALAMPRRHMLSRGWAKRKPVLRTAMAPLLPDEVANRRDAAEFSCYYRDLYLHHRTEVAAIFRESRLADLGIIDLRAVQSALGDGLPGSFTLVVFGVLLSMELWLRQDGS
jgi:asparagine synthase (glutamine-hydrolysing)